MPEGSSSDLERGRRISRRRMARICFGFLILSGCLILGSLLFHPDRAEVATALATAGTLLGTIFATVTLIVLGYLGFSASEKIWGDKR